MEFNKDIKEIARLAMIDTHGMDTQQLEKELSELIKYARSLTEYADAVPCDEQSPNQDRLREDIPETNKSIPLASARADRYIEVPSVMKTEGRK